MSDMDIVVELEELYQELQDKDLTIGDQNRYRDLSQEAVKHLQLDETTLKDFRKINSLLQKLNHLFRE